MLVMVLDKEVFYPHNSSICISEHDIKCYTKKSVVFVRRSKLLKNVTIPSFVLGEEKLTEVDDVKYLGHFISSDGKDDKDMTRACRQLYAQGNSLIRKFHMCTESVKIKLFTTYCSQFYCAHLWNFNNSDNDYHQHTRSMSWKPQERHNKIL